MSSVAGGEIGEPARGFELHAHVGEHELHALVALIGFPNSLASGREVGLGAAEAEALARELDKTHPSAAASLREGMDETLTVLRLDVPPTLPGRGHDSLCVTRVAGAGR